MRYESYQMLNALFRKGKHLGFTLELVNAAIENYNWPVKSLPALHESVLTGARGGVPSPGTSLRYTATQTTDFALASRSLIGPLLPPALRGDPVWLSGCGRFNIIASLTS
jgi:hypothetical protein